MPAYPGPSATNNNAQRSTSPHIAEPVFGRSRWWRRWLGQRSERYALSYFRRLGWRLIAQNQAAAGGEFDLLFWDGQQLVVVEVRSTSQDDPQIAALSVDAAKQRRVCRAAIQFLCRQGVIGAPLRFDVFALAWSSQHHESRTGRRVPRVLHAPGAFTPPDRYQFLT